MSQTGFKRPGGLVVLVLPEGRHISQRMGREGIGGAVLNGNRFGQKLWREAFLRRPVSTPQSISAWPASVRRAAGFATASGCALHRRLQPGCEREPDSSRPEAWRYK